MPIIVLQLIIGYLIYQRYFVNVTEQLTGSVISTIKIADQDSLDEKEFYESLQKYNIFVAAELNANHLSWLDATGAIIRQTFVREFEQPVYIDSRDFGEIVVSFPLHKELISLTIRRSSLAPINPHQIFFNSLAFSIILTLLSLLFLRNQTRSLAKLSRAAKAFGRGESVRYNPTGADEVRSAGRSFLAMRNRIIRQREQRNLMLAGVSHDLKTPLTRLRLTAELLEDESAKQAITEEIRILDELANNFLEYASNDAKEDFEDLQLISLVKKNVNKSENIEIKISQDIHIRVRPILFGRAISNLVGNSKRYAQNISISALKNKANLHLYIDDDGPGIPLELRESALKAFSRLEPERSISTSGHAGLGLAIAGDVIRQHGGNLILDESPQKGLRAEIILPRKIN